MAQGVKTATDEQIAKALEATGGMVELAAKKVGMTGWGVWRRRGCGTPVRENNGGKE